MLRRFGTLLTLLVPIVAWADDDPIKAELDEARTRYSERVDKANETLLAAIMKKSDEAASNGELESLKTIEIQREQFEAYGTLPTAPQLRVAVAAYKTELGLADKAMLDALQKAKLGYTKSKMIEEAEAIVAEIELLTPKAPATDIEQKPAVRDALQPGSVWIGEVARKSSRSPRMETFRLTFTVLEREGNRFRARFDTHNNIREVTGFIGRGQIGWYAKDVKVIEGHEGHDHIGQIRGDRIVLNYSGMAAVDGYPVAGQVRLVRKTDNDR